MYNCHYWTSVICWALLSLFIGLPGSVNSQSVELDPFLIVNGAGEGAGGDVGLHSSLAHDGFGGQHVAYYDRTNESLKYAHRRSPAREWVIHNVDDSGSDGQYCSMDIGSIFRLAVVAGIGNGSTDLNVSFGTPPNRAMIGGRARLVSGGAPWYEIAEVTSNTVILATPYAEVTELTNAFIIEWYQGYISYQGVLGSEATPQGSCLKVARPDLFNPPWKIDHVDPANFQPFVHNGFHTSIAVDEDDQGPAGSIIVDRALHVAYQDRTTTGPNLGILNYAYFDGASWSINSPSQPDSSIGAGTNAKININTTTTLGAANTVVILHYNEVDQELYSSTLSPFGSTWFINRVDNEGVRTGRSLDLTYFEAGNDMVFAYQLAPTTGSLTGRIKHGLARGFAEIFDWTVLNQVWSAPQAGEFISVAHGLTTNTQAIVYYDGFQQDLKLLDSGTNQVTFDTPPVVLDPAHQSGLYCSADRSPVSGDLYVSYYDASQEALKLACWDGSTSTISFIDGDESGTHSDIELTNTEILLAYYHPGEGSLHLARWPLGGVPADGTDIVLDNSSADVGEYPSMVTDPFGRIYIVYYDRTRTNLKIAFFAEGIWTIQVLVGESSTPFNVQNVGEFCDLQIETEHTTSTGILGLAFYDADIDKPIVATATVPAPGPIISLNFLGNPLNSNPGTGRFLSLTFGIAAELHIAYLNENGLDISGNPVFQIGYGLVGGAIERVDQEFLTHTGQWTAIGINEVLNQPEIAYYDLSNGALKFASRVNQNDWSVTIIDSLGDTGLYNVMGYDDDFNFQYILYYNQTAGELRLVKKPIDAPPDAWEAPIVLATDTMGFYPDFKIDRSHRLQISFHQFSTGDLIVTSTRTPPIITRTRDHLWTWY
jgi:hypothetical protein